MKFMLAAYALLLICVGFFVWMVVLVCLAEWLGLAYVGIPISEDRGPYLAIPGGFVYLIGATLLLGRIFNWATRDE